VGDENLDLLLEPSKKKKKSAESLADKTPSRHKWTAETFPMPQLSSRVLTIFERKEFLSKIMVFVQEVGEHFKNIVDKSPAYIYQIYVAALMKNFPQIGESVIAARNAKAALVIKENEIMQEHIGQEERVVEEDIEAPLEDEADEEESMQAKKEGEQKVCKEFGVSYNCQ
jgi:phosphoribosylanthranilate isomerase